jgi:hypothetical protein
MERAGRATRLRRGYGVPIIEGYPRRFGSETPPSPALSRPPLPG